MRRAGHLFERIQAFDALRSAARRAARGTMLGPESAAFLAELECHVLELQRELRDGSYRPGAYRVFRIRDPKPRTISAAPFRDRVVHHALCAALEPVFERYAIDHSYACRPGKGTSAALEHVQRQSRRWSRYVKLDIRHCFESIDHAVLKTLLRRLIKDRRVLVLADRFIDAGAPGSPPGKGLPIGNLTSQHFANLYLGLLDHHVETLPGVLAYCRYMDDVLLFGNDREDLRRALRSCELFVRDRLRQELRAEVCHAGPTAAGVPFLGMRIFARLRRLDRHRVRRFRRRFRGVLRRLRTGAAPDAAALASAAALVGWSEQADTLSLRRSILARHGGTATRPSLRE